MNIDLAPTFLELAWVKPRKMDGESFAGLLLGNTASERPAWRRDFLVEYWGEGRDEVKGCPEKNHQNVSVRMNATD